jgi:hypothetical protein
MAARIPNESHEFPAKENSPIDDDDPAFTGHRRTADIRKCSPDYVFLVHKTTTRRLTLALHGTQWRPTDSPIG